MHCGVVVLSGSSMALQARPRHPYVGAQASARKLSASGSASQSPAWTVAEWWSRSSHLVFGSDLALVLEMRNAGATATARNSPSRLLESDWAALRTLPPHPEGFQPSSPQGMRQSTRVHAHGPRREEQEGEGQEQIGEKPSCEREAVPNWAPSVHLRGLSAASDSRAQGLQPDRRPLETGAEVRSRVEAASGRSPRWQCSFAAQPARRSTAVSSPAP